MWYMPELLRLQKQGVCHRLRLDFCAYGTEWRKTTDIMFVHACPTALARRCPGHAWHQVLRGQGPDGKPWTLYAQPYPDELCSAWAMELDKCIKHLMRSCSPSIDSPRPEGFNSTKGYPGEGPPKAAHGALRQGPRILGETLHTAREDRLRMQWKEHAYDWLRRNGWQPTVVLGSHVSAIPRLREYVQDCFDQGSISYKCVQQALQGVTDEYFNLQGNIKPVWQLMKSWEKGETLDMRCPMPMDVFKCVMVTAVSWEWFSFAALILLAFHALLRPGEFVVLCWGHLLLEEQVHSCNGVGMVALEEPKTRHSHGRVQHVLLTCPWVWWFLKSLKNLLQPSDDQRIFAYSYGTFLRRWQKLMRALHLPDIWTPGSLRAGAATWLYRCGAAIDFIRLRGRWRTLTALEHYVQEASAFAVFQQLPSSLRLFVAMRGEKLWDTLIAAVAELSEKLSSGVYYAPAVDAVVRVHPIMKNLLRRSKLDSLKKSHAEELGK